MLALLTSFFLVFSVLFAPISVDALSLNVNYPEIGGINLNDLAGDDNMLIGLVQWLYFLMIGIAGIAAFIMLVWAGVQWILAAANPAMISDAKDRAYKALLGLALVFGSYLLVQLLNPATLNPSLGDELADLGDRPAIFLPSDPGEDFELPPGSAYVFVTSSTHTGDFGGLAQGDAICQARAGDAGLGGSWTAWLSIESQYARDRIQQAPEGYFLLDGTRVADSFTHLIDEDADLHHPINMDEHGNRITSMTSVWTATHQNGTWVTPDCSGWTTTSSGIITNATTGTLTFTSHQWTRHTAGMNTPCGQSTVRLYCFGNVVP